VVFLTLLHNICISSRSQHARLGFLFVLEISYHKGLDGKSTPQERLGSGVCVYVNVGNTQYIKERDTKDFMWKPLIGKNHGEEDEEIPL